MNKSAFSVEPWDEGDCVVGAQAPDDLAWNVTPIGRVASRAKIIIVVDWLNSLMPAEIDALSRLFSLLDSGRNEVKP